MSIVSQQVPTNLEQLYQYVPKETYIKEGSLNDRRVNNVTASEPGLISDAKAGRSGRFTFTQEASFQNFTSLKESYFHINGTIRYSTKKTTVAILNYENLSFNSHWLLSLINSIELSIGGKTIQQITTPGLMANIKASLKHDFRNVDAGTLHQYGIQNGIQNGSSKTVGNCAQPDNSTVLGNFKDLVAATDNTYKTFLLPFSVMIPLKDLFELPDAALYGLKCQVLFTRESHSIPAITIIQTGVSTNAKYNAVADFGDSLEVAEFSRFDLCVVTYQVSGEFQTMLRSFYNKVQREPINYADQQLITLTSTASNTNFSFSQQYQLGFESKFICLAFAKHSSNTLVSNKGNIILAATKNKGDATDPLFTTSAGVNSTSPFATRYVPLASYEVFIDSVSVYRRDMTNSRLKYEVAHNTDGSLESMMAYNNDGDYYDQTVEYQNYKLCRQYYNKDHTVNNCLTYADFITKNYALYIPLSSFSKLSSGSTIRINMQFANWSEHRSPLKNSHNDTITSLILYNMNSKQLVYNNGVCELKTVNETFSNDIDIEAPSV